MNDLTTGRAQIHLAYIYAVGFFITLFILIFFARDLDEFTKSVLLTMLGYLGALVQQQSSYFFARQRPDTPPPNTERKITDTIVQVPPPKDPTVPDKPNPPDGEPRKD